MTNSAKFAVQAEKHWNAYKQTPKPYICNQETLNPRIGRADSQKETSTTHRPRKKLERIRWKNQINWFKVLKPRVGHTQLQSENVNKKVVWNQSTECESKKCLFSKEDGCTYFDRDEIVLDLSINFQMLPNWQEHN